MPWVSVPSTNAVESQSRETLHFQKYSCELKTPFPFPCRRPHPITPQYQSSILVASTSMVIVENNSLRTPSSPSHTASPLHITSALLAKSISGSLTASPRCLSRVSHHPVSSLREALHWDSFLR